MTTLDLLWLVHFILFLDILIQELLVRNQLMNNIILQHFSIVASGLVKLPRLNPVASATKYGEGFQKTVTVLFVLGELRSFTVSMFYLVEIYALQKSSNCEEISSSEKLLIRMPSPDHRSNPMRCDAIDSIR